MLHVTSLPPIPAPPCRYSTTDGYLPLREYIAARYRRRLGVPATAGEIQITNGSQQCLDLFAKIFLNAGDRVGVERPGTSGQSRPSRSTSRSLRPCGSTAKGRIPVRLKKCSWRDR